MFGLRSLPRQACSHQSWPVIRRCCSEEAKGNVRLSRSFARMRGPSIPSKGTTAPSPKLAQSKKPRRRIGLIVVGSTLLLGYGFLTFTQTGKFGTEAVTRASRVVGTTFVNISDYRKTLKQSENMDRAGHQAELKACHKRCAERTMKAMEKNGSVYIKLGQHLTSLNYMLPSEWCETFIPLQDRCPVTSFEAVKKMVEHDTGARLEDMFTSFAEEPLGAASLAQVHTAIDRKSGQKVAVKVQHPTLDEWARMDLALTSWTFRQLKKAFPDYDLTWLSDEMEISLPQELDFNLEAQNAERARAYFDNFPEIPLVIPKVLWAKRRICVMEFLTGHRPDDLKYLDENNISRDEVSATLANIFNTMIFTRGAPLHCDPHGGNLAIRVNPSRRSSRHNFDVILYDHGLYRIIPQDIQRSYAKLWLAVIDADEPRMRKYAHDVAGITDEQFPLFASAITGRDYRVVTQNVASVARTDEEKEAISDALAEGMLQQLVHLLGQVPRIILLILKTNDLTRSLDTNLHTTQGPMRSFLILARYAARTVYDEQLEILRAAGGLVWPPAHAVLWLRAWGDCKRVELKLGAYEWWLWVRGVLGWRNELPAGLPGTG